MKRKTDLRLRCLGLLLVAALMAPSLGQAQEQREGSYSELQQRLIKELNLTPEKAKEFQAVSGKYEKSRAEIIGKIEKSIASWKKPWPLLSLMKAKSMNWWPRPSRGKTSSSQLLRLSARRRWPF